MWSITRLRDPSVVRGVANVATPRFLAKQDRTPYGAGDPVSTGVATSLRNGWLWFRHNTERRGVAPQINPLFRGS